MEQAAADAIARTSKDPNHASETANFAADVYRAALDDGAIDRVLIRLPEQDTINGPIIKCGTVDVRGEVCCLTRMIRIFACPSYGIGYRLLH